MKFLRTRIAYDDQPESPREWSNVGTFVGFEHNHYNIGDRRPTEAEMRFLRKGGVPLLLKYLKRTEGATRVLLVGMIDHSGVSYYIGGGTAIGDDAGWDSGTCGFIYDTKEKREECGCEPGTYEGEIDLGYLRGKIRGQVDRIEKVLTDEIDIYSQWANGEVYMYCVEERTLCALCEARIASDIGCDLCPDTEAAHNRYSDHVYTPHFQSLPDECPHCETVDDWCGGNYGEVDDWDIPTYAKAQMKEQMDRGNIESDHGHRITAPWVKMEEPDASVSN